MHTTTIHVKLDAKTRDEAKLLAQEFGFSLSDLVKVLLKRIIKTKTITLGIEKPTEYFIKALKESEKDYREGRFISFEKGEDALRYFKKLASSHEPTK